MPTGLSLLYLYFFLKQPEWLALWVRVGNSMTNSSQWHWLQSELKKFQEIDKLGPSIASNGNLQSHSPNLTWSLLGSESCCRTYIPHIQGSSTYSDLFLHFFTSLLMRWLMDIWRMQNCSFIILSLSCEQHLSRCFVNSIYLFLCNLNSNTCYTSLC